MVSYVVKYYFREALRRVCGYFFNVMVGGIQDRLYIIIIIAYVEGITIFCREHSRDPSTLLLHSFTYLTTYHTIQHAYHHLLPDHNIITVSSSSSSSS